MGLGQGRVDVRCDVVDEDGTGCTAWIRKKISDEMGGSNDISSGWGQEGNEFESTHGSMIA
jgi:hypothetical protein